MNGKKVLITGGSRGIGKELVCQMVNSGAEVAFTYQNSKSLAEEIVNEYSKLGKKCLCFQADVRNRKRVTEIMKSLESNWGELDILINNAGINRPTDFDKITDEDWDEILSVNLKGPFIISQTMLPLLKKSKSASIIHIASVSGQYGGPRTAHYAASKAGLISLSQVIARFGAAHGIRSNTIAVGLIDSDMGKFGLTNPLVAKASEDILVKRLGTFSEVASVAVFLGSDDSSYITAQTINVNGGLYF